uniref:Uncharacterized protein n=1 Tax=Panagrolaimus sp. PS1159 TaxID=55785 RepID=A0AC35GP14_9BILA
MAFFKESVLFFIFLPLIISGCNPINLPADYWGPAAPAPPTTPSPPPAQPASGPCSACPALTTSPPIGACPDPSFSACSASNVITATCGGGCVINTKDAAGTSRGSAVSTEDYTCDASGKFLIGGTEVTSVLCSF